MAISSVGLGSGLPLNDLISQLVAAEGAPTQGRLDRREASIQTELSAIGVLRGALSDFQDKLSALADADSFLNRKAASSNSSIATIDAEQSAAEGVYSLEVSAIATAQNIVGLNGYTDASEGVLTFSNQAGETFDVTIGSDDATLEGVVAVINNEATNFGVTAKILNVGGEGRLVLTANETGVESRITSISATGTGDILNFKYDYALAINGDDENWDQTIEAGDASFSVEGQAMTSASNTLEDIIPGATITLKAETEVDTPISLSVTSTSSSTRKMIEDFVEAYNTLNTTIANQTSYDAATERAGALQGDALTRSIQSQLKSMISGTGSEFGSLSALANFGITTQRDGSLLIASTDLTSVLENNFDDVIGFFSDENNGLANRLDNLLESYVSSSGTFSSRTESLNESLDRIDTQRDVLASRMEKLEARYLAQFTAMDALVANLTSTGNFLNQQLSSIAQIQTARYKN